MYKIGGVLLDNNELSALIQLGRDGPRMDKDLQNRQGMTSLMNRGLSYRHDKSDPPNRLTDHGIALYAMYMEQRLGVIQSQQVGTQTTIDTNSDRTPISQTPIERINADDWTNMSINELTTQQHILNNRMMVAQTTGQVAAIAGIQRGLQMIDLLLKEKGAFIEPQLL